MDATSKDAAWLSAADGIMDDALGTLREHLDDLVAEAVERLKADGEEYRPLERLPKAVEDAASWGLSDVTDALEVGKEV